MEHRVSINYVHAPHPRVEKVILTHVSRGAGVPEDPCRTVEQVHHQDGGFIAENDPCVEPDKLRARIHRAEEMFRSLRKHSMLSAADNEMIDKFFDPEPL